jgi:Kdo2-lipid IVA lauroyltransferase/acyltransferase
VSERRLADALERGAVASARLFIALLARLPHDLVLGGARALADCAFFLRVRRRAMLSNLDRVYGDRITRAEKLRVARSAMRNLFLSAAEMARGSHPRARGEVAHTLEFEPRALVDELAADPRGSLLVVAHSGNFDLCGLRFTLDYGRPLAVVMKPLGTPRFDELLVGARRSFGFEVLSAQERGLVLGCARRLREGGVVCMLPDQFARAGGVVVDFLGVPASTHAGPALAALRARGCRIFVVVDTRVADGARHVCHVRELKDFEPSGDAHADVLRLTQRLCDEMGEIVRAHPESYLWQHRRWRRHRTLSARRRRRRERSSAAAQPPGRSRALTSENRGSPRDRAARALRQPMRRSHVRSGETGRAVRSDSGWNLRFQPEKKRPEDAGSIRAARDSARPVFARWRRAFNRTYASAFRTSRGVRRTWR